MKIEGFHGYNVKFSPHSPFELGIVGGCNFGMTGNDIGEVSSSLNVFTENEFRSFTKIKVFLGNKPIFVLIG